VKTGLLWLIGHVSRFLPVLVIGVVLALTWNTLRQVHPRDVTAALRAMSAAWLAVAAAITVLNIGVMGLYDVVAFRHTRTRASERWRYGAVAFAWTNFLTLGPLAGPAIRFWLYGQFVEHSSDLETGVLSITIAFVSGLIGWTIATFIVPSHGTIGNAVALTATAGVIVYACVYAGRLAAVRVERFDDLDPSPRASLGPALIGWLDWLLAGLAFLACLHSTGADVADVESIRDFFIGQAIGLGSLVPGGFGSSDAFWIAHLPMPTAVTAAALVAYRLVYYIVPWAAASLVLLSWATRRASRRV
jgi:phosphatidylglycerol lysyltransferase